MTRTPSRPNLAGALLAGAALVVLIGVQAGLGFHLANHAHCADAPPAEQAGCFLCLAAVALVALTASCLALPARGLDGFLPPPSGSPSFGRFGGSRSARAPPAAVA